MELNPLSLSLFIKETAQSFIPSSYFKTISYCSNQPPFAALNKFPNDSSLFRSSFQHFFLIYFISILLINKYWYFIKKLQY